ncbi:MAG: DUF2924 domain-containing protein [Betaproteobacteria bacterium]|nr:MAG: DUF2924 domain-containing protein [Betaproteobacteria bacterium]
MRTIEVDFDVFKALTIRRPSEAVTENDVLRELLGLPPREHGAVGETPSSADDWVVKGVRFPAGTELRAKYKGQIYLGRVERGALVLNSKSFASPSAAAVSVTGNPVNGWNFWEARRPGSTEWTTIRALRKG